MPGRFNGPVKALAGLVAAGLLLEGVYVALAARSPDRDALYGTIVLQLAAGVLFLAAAIAALAERTVERRGRTYLVIVGFAVVFRATLVVATPSLSTDVWRYAWEGRVQAHLQNPYRLAPDAPELAPLRDSVWERVEHKEVPAVYGPLAEASFFLLRAPGFMKIFFALADLVVLALVGQALHRRGLPSSLSVLYGWHPLPIMETAGQGHLDSFGVALLLLALEHAERNKRVASVALGLAASVKFLPLALLPAFGRRTGMKVAAGALLVFLLTLLPYGLPRGLGRYATEWRFNATGLVAIEEALDRTGAGERVALLLARGDRRLAHDTPYDKAPQRIAAGLLVGAVALALALRARLETAVFGTIAAVVAFSPVVHPWYLLWLLPFAIQRRSVALLELTLAAPMSYAVLLEYDGTRESWHEAAWPRVLLVVPFLALLVWENARHAGERVQGAP